jgi:hypothetical protein
MPAFAERTTVANDHRPYRRVGCRLGESARGQLNRSRQIGRVESVYGVTSTPFQNAMYPLMFLAASLGVG